MHYYQAPNKSLWQGRQDSLSNERYFQIIHCADLAKEKIHLQQKKTIAFCGFCCDEGIKRNLGRPGANSGPDVLRQTLAKLAIHHSENLFLYDVGNVVCENGNLEDAQTNLANIVSNLIDKKILPIVFGGGHEVAWGNYQGIIKANADLNIGIINFDAHFDLRPLLPGNKGSSGTSFRQIAKERQNSQQAFKYLCLGIQPTANTKSLFAFADQLNVEYIFAEIFHENKIKFIMDTLSHFLDKVDFVYLSVCLDVFSQIYAPGVSAPQINGIFPQQIIPLLRCIAQTNKILSLDIAELSPKFDLNNQTASLGAYLISQIVEQFAQL